MEIQVDGSRQEVQPLPATIGQLVSELRGAVTTAGKVVISVTVDGREMNEGEEVRISAQPVEEFANVSVLTAEPRVLCIETLEEVSRHVEPVIDECNRIADLIDAGKEAPAFERIVPCMEVWGAILGAVQKIAVLMEIDLENVGTEDETLTDSVTALVSFLQSLKGRIDSHDLVSVRDAMKHEMPEIADRISRQLTALSTAIAPA